MKREWRLKVDIPFAKAGDVASYEFPITIAIQEGKIGCCTLKPSEWPEFFELVEESEE